MVQIWSAGEYMQIDYAGGKITLFPEADSKQNRVRIFACVSVLVAWFSTTQLQT